MKKQQGYVEFCLLVLVTLVVVMCSIYGYIANIVKLVHMGGIEGHAGEFIIRVIGVFTGIIGAIVGYF